MTITTQTSGSAESGPSKKIKLSLCPPDYLPSTVPTGIEAEETTSFIPLPVLNDIQENGDQIYRTYIWNLSAFRDDRDLTDSIEYQVRSYS
jgi:hypothetical protein